MSLLHCLLLLLLDVVVALLLLLLLDVAACAPSHCLMFVISPWLYACTVEGGSGDGEDTRTAVFV
jgi:hypothetical protein